MARSSPAAEKYVFFHILCYCLLIPHLTRQRRSLLPPPTPPSPSTHHSRSHTTHRLRIRRDHHLLSRRLTTITVGGASNGLPTSHHHHYNQRDTYVPAAATFNMPLWQWGDGHPFSINSYFCYIFYYINVKYMLVAQCTLANILPHPTNLFVLLAIFLMSLILSFSMNMWLWDLFYQGVVLQVSGIWLGRYSLQSTFFLLLYLTLAHS